MKWDGYPEECNGTETISDQGLVDLWSLFLRAHKSEGSGRLKKLGA